MNSSLFSHAGQPEPAQEPVFLPDIVVERIVPRELHEAFNGFTEYVHLWWPEEHTQFGEGTHPEFEADALTETGPAGESAVWATVAERVQDAQLLLGWRVRHSPQTPTTVTISFAPADEAGTLVSVTHSGLDMVADPVETHQEFAAFWPQVMDRYVRFMGAR